MDGQDFVGTVQRCRVRRRELGDAGTRGGGSHIIVDHVEWHDVDAVVARELGRQAGGGVRDDGEGHGLKGSSAPERVRMGRRVGTGAIIRLGELGDLHAPVLQAHDLLEELAVALVV